MRVVKEMPGCRRSLTKNNWGMLCDGRIRELVQGEDFGCSIASFRVQFHREAKARGRQGETSVADGKLYVVAVDPSEKRKGK